MRLILASASPRRAELLTAAGFTFEVCPSDVDESVRPGEGPRDYVMRLAREKAARAFEMIAGPADCPAEAGRSTGPEPGPQRGTGGPPDDVLIIAADTAVIVDGRILGKPADDADAARMLRLLSGRPHTVLTGVGARGRRFEQVVVEETLVQFVPLTDEQVAWYVGTGEGRDKAGGYAIQGLASRFIPRIEGSYTNVVGLPVAAVGELIRAAEGDARAVASGR
jgi:septum formation protein